MTLLPPVRGLHGEHVLMRMYVEHEARWQEKPLYVAIVEVLRDRHFAGATVFHGLETWSVWWHHLVHPHESPSESEDAVLNIVIEAVDTPEHIVSVLPILDSMIGRGVITLERATVIVYRPRTGEERDAETARDPDGVTVEGESPEDNAIG